MVIPCLCNPHHMKVVHGCVRFQLPLANCHKVDGSKPHQFILLQFWGPEVWNESYWAVVKVLGNKPGLFRNLVPSESARGECVSLPSLSFRGHLYSLACLFLRLQSQRQSILSVTDSVSFRFSHHMSFFFSSSLTRCFPLTRILVIYWAQPASPEKSLLLKILNLVTPSKSFWPCKVFYPQVLGIRPGHPWGLLQPAACQARRPSLLRTPWWWVRIMENLLCQALDAQICNTSVYYIMITFPACATLCFFVVNSYLFLFFGFSYFYHQMDFLLIDWTAYQFCFFGSLPFWTEWCQGLPCSCSLGFTFASVWMVLLPLLCVGSVFHIHVFILIGSYLGFGGLIYPIVY